MAKFLLTFSLALFASGCASKDKAYSLDGVPVILEQGKGPDHDHLLLAVTPFRLAVSDHFELEDDLTVWRSLRAIEYRVGPVDGQALYHYEDETVYSNWYSCALDVPLYRALAAHYNVAVSTEEAFRSDMEWADALQDENEASVCSTAKPPRTTITLPW